MENTQHEHVTLVYFDGKAAKFNPYIPKDALLRSGAIFVDTEGVKYSVVYYSDVFNVAFALAYEQSDKE